MIALKPLSELFVFEVTRMFFSIGDYTARYIILAAYLNEIVAGIPSAPYTFNVTADGRVRNPVPCPEHRYFIIQYPAGRCNPCYCQPVICGVSDVLNIHSDVHCICWFHSCIFNRLLSSCGIIVASRTALQSHLYRWASPASCLSETNALIIDDSVKK